MGVNSFHRETQTIYNTNPKHYESRRVCRNVKLKGVAPRSARETIAIDMSLFLHHAIRSSPLASFAINAAKDDVIHLAGLVSTMRHQKEQITKELQTKVQNLREKVAGYFAHFTTIARLTHHLLKSGRRILFVFDGAHHPGKHGTDLLRQDLLNKGRQVLANALRSCKICVDKKGDSSDDDDDDEADATGSSLTDALQNVTLVRNAITLTIEDVWFFKELIQKVAEEHEFKLYEDFMFLLAATEADSTLVNLVRENNIQNLMVMSSDGDLFHFGVNRLLSLANHIDAKTFAMSCEKDFDGFEIRRMLLQEGSLTAAKLQQMFPTTRSSSASDENAKLLFTFRIVCILSGMDYCPNVWGKSIAAARSLVSSVLLEMDSVESMSEENFKKTLLSGVFTKIRPWFEDLKEEELQLMKTRFRTFVWSPAQTELFGTIVAPMAKLLEPPRRGGIKKDENEGGTRGVLCRFYIVLFCRALASVQHQWVVSGFKFGHPDTMNIQICNFERDLASSSRILSHACSSNNIHVSSQQMLNEIHHVVGPRPSSQNMKSLLLMSGKPRHLRSTAKDFCLNHERMQHHQHLFRSWMAMKQVGNAPKQWKNFRADDEPVAVKNSTARHDVDEFHSLADFDDASLFVEMQESFELPVTLLSNELTDEKLDMIVALIETISRLNWKNDTAQLVVPKNAFQENSACGEILRTRNRSKVAGLRRTRSLQQNTYNQTVVPQNSANYGPTHKKTGASSLRPVTASEGTNYGSSISSPANSQNTSFAASEKNSKVASPLARFEGSASALDNVDWHLYQFSPRNKGEKKKKQK